MVEISFYFLINVSIANSYILLDMSNRQPKTAHGNRQLHYTRNLVWQMIGDFTSWKHAGWRRILPIGAAMLRSLHCLKKNWRSHEKGSSAMIYIPSFTEIGSAMRKLMGGIHRQHGDRISLHLFFENKENRLKIIRRWDVRSKTGIVTWVSIDIVSFIWNLYKLIISELHKLNFASVIPHTSPKEEVLSH
jgi:hypothetical protein